MDFEITTSEGEVFRYNNLTNRLTKNDELVCLDHVKGLIMKPQTNIVEPFDEKDHPSLSKGKYIKWLRLFLGYNCNYHCGYCTQTVEQLSSPVPSKEKVDALFKKLDDTGIKVDEKAIIQLWGGEPFVYLKTLKYLIPELRKRYPKAHIWTISNGSLMNQSILEFLLENKIHLSFSHDGPAYFLRGEDPLKDPKLQKIWRKTAETYLQNDLNFGINTVISQYNADLFEVQDYLFKNIMEGVRMNFEGVVVAHTQNSVEFTHFQKEARDKLERSINRAFFEEPESMVTFALLQGMQKFLGMVSQQASAMTIMGRCNTAMKTVLTVDFDGNIFSCHNASSTRQYVGTLDDYDGIDMDKFTHWSRRPQCPDCLVLDYCRGNCIRDDAEAHRRGCPVQKMFFTMLFKAAFKLMTGQTVAAIKPLA